MAAKVAGMIALVALAFGRGATPASHVRPSRDASVSTASSAAAAVDRAGADPVRLWRMAELREPRRRRSRIPRETSPRANVLGVIVRRVLYLSLNLAYLWVLTPRADGRVARARRRHGARGRRRGRRADSSALLIVVSSLGFLAVVDPDRAAALLRDGGRRPVLPAARRACIRAIRRRCSRSGFRRPFARAADDQHLRSAAVVRRVRRLAVLRADGGRAAHRPPSRPACPTAKSRGARASVTTSPSSPSRPASSSTASSSIRRSR